MKLKDLVIRESAKSEIIIQWTKKIIVEKQKNVANQSETLVRRIVQIPMQLQFCMKITIQVLFEPIFTLRY